MKPLTLLGTVLTATFFLAACDPHHNPRKEQTTAGPKKADAEKPNKPGTATLPPDGGPDETGPVDHHDRVNTDPTSTIPKPPTPEKEEYAKKITGKPGFVTDPNDPQGRPLDVRNMPPGTKIQSPFSGSVLLVPPQ